MISVESIRSTYTKAAKAIDLLVSGHKLMYSGTGISATGSYVEFDSSYEYPFRFINPPTNENEDIGYAWNFLCDGDYIIYKYPRIVEW